METAKLLKDYEKYVYELADRYPYLQAFFVDVSREADPVKRANMQITILLQNGIESCPDVPSKEIARIPQWKDVPALVDLLWGPDDFHNKGKVRLRRAHDLGEQILYLLLEAYDANKRGAIDNDVYEEWIPYFDEIGSHPIFLAAVYYGHSAGYFKKDFAQELVRRLDLEKNRKAKETVQAIYPDMLKPDWVDRIGKK